MASDDALTSGTLFAGRYEIVRCIARGGMGAIYEVVHVETARRRALKVILPDKLKSAELRERFRQEARVAAQIDSEFIVDVFDAGVDDATQMPFMVMELLKGENLEDRVEKVGRVPPADVVTYLHQLALALEKTHAANIVHRDLKPENLFLTQRDDGQPRIKVLDFGVAKVLAEGASESQTTRSLGTPLYMSPEQYTAASRVAPATDVYALGMISYTLLTGGAYYLEEAERDGNIALFSATIRTGPREAPSARAGRAGVSIPRAYDAWFTRVTAVDPKQRFPGAMAAVTELAAALSVPLPGAQPAPAPKPAPKPVIGPGSTAPMATVPLPAPAPQKASLGQTVVHQPGPGAAPSPAYGGAIAAQKQQAASATPAVREPYPAAQAPFPQQGAPNPSPQNMPPARAPEQSYPAMAPFAQTPLAQQPPTQQPPVQQGPFGSTAQPLEAKRGSGALLWIVAGAALVIAGVVTALVLLRGEPSAPGAAPSAAAPVESAAIAPPASATAAPSAEPPDAPASADVPAPSATSQPKIVPRQPRPRRR